MASVFFLFMQYFSITMSAMFGSFSKRIYLDYASATPILSQAQKKMRESEALIGNPSSLHKEGVIADAALELAREKVAHELACKPRELIFTSGLTEANNLSIFGAFRAIEEKESITNTHWITSAIEHPSILAPFREIERRGGRVTYIAPTRKGIVTPESVGEALTPETRFVSIGWANNETGTVQSLARIARVIREYEKKHSILILFHTDAGQAPLYRHPSVHTLHVDLMTIGSNKLYGPRGAGVLYIGQDVTIRAEHIGGGQERDIRSGTENLPAIAGFAEALSVVSKEREAESRRMLHLKGILTKGVLDGIEGSVLNGDPAHALPHIVNVSIPGVSGEYLTLALDTKGIAVSAKSACKEGEAKRSHVIAAMVGKDEAEMWRAESAIRFSLGRDTREKDIYTVIDVLKKLVVSMKEG